VRTPLNAPWRRHVSRTKPQPCMNCYLITEGKYLRTYVRGSLRLLLCKECFLKFVAEDVRNGQRQPKLVRQPLKGEQLELPF
jgi:hypothetical protein